MTNIQKPASSVFNVDQPVTRRFTRNRRRCRRLFLETLEARQLFAVDWRNPVDALDVDGNGFVVPLDALLLINRLNSGESGALPLQRDVAKPFLDVNGDQFVAPIDALLVINHLNSNSGGQRRLDESNKLAAEADVTITLGQSSGARNYRVQIDTTFDTSDKTAALEDLLAVYLVDPQQPNTTLLDRGTPGTALFTLVGNRAEFDPGLVSWDGSVLQIDTSAAAQLQTGVLKFQLLNSDGDKGSQITIKPLANEVNPNGTAGSLLLPNSPPTSAGPTLNAPSLQSAAGAEVVIDNVRFNSQSGKYEAELRVRSTTESLGQQLAVAFPGLPTGVQLINASGAMPDGAPYINVSAAVGRGGLLQGLWSRPVRLELQDPGQLLFALKPQVFASTNHAPLLEPLAPITLMPGHVLRVGVNASDQDGDPLTFSMTTDDASSLSSRLSNDGTLVLRPAPTDIGTHPLSITASDGALSASQSITVNVVADPITTTRVSGKVLAVDGAPLANMRVEIGAVQGLTQSDGSFLLDLGPSTIISDTLRIRGELFSSSSVYPFIAEKLPLLLEHAVYPSVTNFIERPIYLPALDVASGSTIDPANDTTVTNSAIPGAKVTVAAGTLMNQQGIPFTGVLSMTEVPVSLTPAALPPGLNADLVVTIQPGEMVFSVPTPLTLPNKAGYASGTLLDLWSINPVTGQFDNVGIGRVSVDGSVIETISGGIRNSSWHFFGPQAPTGPKVADDPRNKKPGGCGDKAAATSSCELHSGALIETHDLVTYQSQGIQRGFQLTYDSLRADARPIVHFTFSDLDPADYSVPDATRLVANLEVSRAGRTQSVPGFAGNAYGLDGGEHFWRLPQQAGSVDAALQVDMRDQPSGVYSYTLRSGMLGYAGSRGFIGTLNQESGQLVTVNSVASPLGAGWGISGLLELIVSSEGSVLVVDGNGSEELYLPNGSGGYHRPPGVFATLNKLGDGTFERTWPDQTKERYNTQGKLATITDRNGNVSRYDYDASGRIMRYTDPVGLQTTLTYSAGRVDIADPAGRVTRLDLDAAGNLIRVTDPDGTARTWQYDAQHRMVAETDQLGNTERATYGFHGRLTDVTRKDGSTRRYRPVDVQGLFPSEQTSADPLGPLTPLAGRVPLPEATFIDVNGNVTVNTLDARGQTVSSRDSLGRLPQVLRNSENLPVQVSDALGQTRWNSYDQLGNLVGETSELTVRQSTFGNALNLNGPLPDGTERRFKQYALTDESPVLDLQSLTLEGWFNIDSYSPGGDRDIVPFVGKARGSATTSNDYAYWYEDGLLKGGIFNGTTMELVTAPWQPQFGRWYHVAYTFNDADNAHSLFVDGIEIASARTISSPQACDYSGCSLYVGQQYFKYRDGPAEFPSNFKGLVDEVRLWNRARTATEIRSDMFRSLAGSEPGLVAYFQMENTGVDRFDNLLILDSTANDLHARVLSSEDEPEFVASSLTLAEAVQAPAGVVGWWTADGYANDLAGAHNGVLRGGTAFAPGMVDQGFRFDGVDDVVRIADAADSSLDITANLTIDAWISPSQTSGSQRTIVQKRPGSSNSNVTYGFYLEEDGRLAFTSRQSDSAFRTVSTAATVPLNQWTHVAVTIQDGVLRLYINGTVAAEQPYTFTRPATDGPMSIGSTIVGGGISEAFAGSIDEVQLFNRALSTEEIRAIVKAERAGQSKPRVFDATSSYSIGLNPSGTWQYGYSTAQDRSFKSDTLQFDGSGLLTWGATGSGPFVSRPRSRTHLHYVTISHGADVLNLDPSLDARNSVLQWTAPQTGTFTLLGRFEGLDSTTTDVTIHLNDAAGTPLLAGGLNGLHTEVAFNLPLNLQAGDRVQFTVNPRGDGRYDSTGLSATFVLEGSAAAPSTPTGSSVATTAYTYDPAFNQLTSIIDAVSRQTQLTVDPSNGNTTAIAEIVDAVGGGDDRVTSIGYTADGLMEQLTDPRGTVTRFGYDALGRLTEIINAFGTSIQSSQKSEYDMAGRIVSFTDENGQRTRWSYDAMNRVTKLTRPDGAETLFEYDARGNRRKTIDVLGQVSQQTFDALDRVKQTEVAGVVTRFSYDLAGNLTSVTDPLNQTDRYQYDKRGRLVSETDAAGHATRYEYDAVDRLLSVRDGSGNKTQYGYDALGRTIRQTDALGQTTRYSYDAAGQLVQLKQRNGQLTRYEYSDVGELVSEQWLSSDLLPVNALQYSYDAGGLLLQAGDATSTLRYTRDAIGRVTREDMSGPGGLPTTQLDTTFDAVGNVLTRRDVINGSLGATETSLYDSLNRVTRIVQAGADVATKRVDLAYNALGQLTELKRSSDALASSLVVDTDFAYDALHRLTTISHKNSGQASLNTYTYQFDAHSRITLANDIDGAVNFRYDARDQLISSLHSDPLNPDESYSYDATGNRRSSHVHGDKYVLGSTAASAPHGNRLTNDGKIEYSYDANGNTTQRREIATGRVRDFSFDHRNRLIEIVERASQSGPVLHRIQYAYDAADRRIATYVDSTPADHQPTTATYFVYAGLDVIAELSDPDGAGPLPAVLDRRYLHGPAVDQVLAQETADGDVQWLLADHLGTIRDVVDEAGQVVNHIKYDSFGNTLSQSDPAVTTRYRFTGREFDVESGLQYNRARYYDAAIGRFLNEDSFGPLLGGVNLYAYVGNGPTMFTDPSGHLANLGVGAATAATGYVGGYYGNLAAQAFGPGGGGFNDLYYGNLDFDAAGISGAFGAASGAALAIPGVGIGGATAIGGASNLGQYGYTTPMEDWNGADAAWNAGTGAAAGLLGGAAGKAVQKFGPVQVGGKFGPTLYGGKALTKGDHFKANVAPKAAATAMAGGVGSNLPNLGREAGKKPDRCKLK